jgi:Helix-turn-helix domain
MLARHEPQVLRPFHRSEALSIAEAAAIAGKSVRTVREWCARLDIGRRIGGQWAVSRVALAMFLDGDREALAAYLRGDRTSPMIAEYFASCRVPVPKTEPSP